MPSGCGCWRRARPIVGCRRACATRPRPRPSACGELARSVGVRCGRGGRTSASSAAPSPNDAARHPRRTGVRGARCRRRPASRPDPRPSAPSARRRRGFRRRQPSSRAGKESLFGRPSPRGQGAGAESRPLVGIMPVSDRSRTLRATTLSCVLVDARLSRAWSPLLGRRFRLIWWVAVWLCGVVTPGALALPGCWLCLDQRSPAGGFLVFSPLAGLFFGGEGVNLDLLHRDSRDIGWVWLVRRLVEV